MQVFRKKRVYLDWAAAAPVSSRAAGVFAAALAAYGNPGSPHAEGRAARAVLEDARPKVARLAEVKPEGVVFTAGATEANALAILGSVRARGASGSHVLYQASQHASVIGALRMLEAEGAQVEALEGPLHAQLRRETALVSMDAVNSETGEIFDTLAARRALDAAESRALFHVDASQAPFAMPFTLAHVGADLLTLDAQKAGGVRGAGALLVRSGVALAPLMAGGGQERGRRPGTENVSAIAAFASALAEASEVREKFIERARAQRARLVARVRDVPGLALNEGKMNASSILNISLPGRDTDYLVALLDTAGFAVSTKSACESDSDEGSRAVLAMTGDAERAKATLRISWGPTTPDRDLERFADALVHAIRFLDGYAI